MKELFDRHQQKLTDTEDRKVWRAIHDATRSKGRSWKRFGIPISALATTAAAAAVIMMVTQAPSISERVIQEQTALLDDLEKDQLRDLDGALNIRGHGKEMSRATGDNRETYRVGGEPSRNNEGIYGLDGNLRTQPHAVESFEASKRVGGRPERRFGPPTPAPVKIEELSADEMKNNQPAKPMSEGVQKLKASRDEWRKKNQGNSRLEVLTGQGSVSGRVVSTKGEPLSFANVVIHGTNLGSMTDAEGSFVVKNIPAGDYTIKVSYLGYEAQERSFQIRDQSELAEDFSLSEAVVATMQTLTIAAGRDMIRRGGVETGEEQEKLPGDTFTEAVGLKAGVVSQAGDLHFRGGRTASQSTAIVSANRYRSEQIAGDAVDNREQIKRRAKKPGPPRRNPISVGGTAPVNGKAIDAMFFQNYGVNPFVDPEEDRFATFSVDVDNASYALSRAYLNRGVLPPQEAVRVEEFVNSFKHNYAPPRNPLMAGRKWARSEKGTFAIHLDAAPSPFGKGLVMMRVGLKGREIFAEERKPANLTFVVDVSGSMQRENRLGLVKQSLFTLLDALNAEDQVGLVVYGSTARVLLPPTSLVNRRLIESAIARLHPEGATNAEAGLRKGYAMAERAYQRDCINRVILCSDGVANVGKTGADEILQVIKRQAGEGIYLTAVGFGMGNYNDVLLEKLANQGDGNYYYVDSLKEARKVFVENLTGTLQTIARQVKIQVEFESDSIRRYRLLGYENRAVADRDFRNNKIDAGEVGAGHEVTALFEMKLNKNARPGNLATVRIRYEDPETGRVTEETRVLRTDDVARRFRDTDPTFRMDAAVAEFAEILRHSYWAKDGDLSGVFSMAKDASREMGRPQDLKEMVNLVELAWQLWPRDTKDRNYEVRPSWDPDDEN